MSTNRLAGMAEYLAADGAHDRRDALPIGVWAIGAAVVWRRFAEADGCGIRDIFEEEMPKFYAFCRSHEEQMM